MTRTIGSFWLFTAVAVCQVLASSNVAFADQYTYTTLNVPGSVDTVAQGINDSNQVVGSYISAATNVQSGFLESGGVYTSLNPLGSIVSQALGINNAGQVVGYYGDSLGGHGFIESGGVYTTLNVPGANDTYATGINNVGQVVGYCLI